MYVFSGIYQVGSNKDSQSASVALLHGTYRQPKIGLSFTNCSEFQPWILIILVTFKYETGCRPGIGQKRE